MSELNGSPIPDPSADRRPVVPPAPPAYAQPGASAYGQPAAADPGRTLGIVGFILAFFVSPAGIIVSAIALAKSRKSGNKNGFALAGLILSIVFLIISVVFIGLLIGAAAALLGQCADLGSGVQQINGVSVTCP